jgi:N-(2-amino-2-carboxyethyl)-L-glutamate synthase
MSDFMALDTIPPSAPRGRPPPARPRTQASLHERVELLRSAMRPTPMTRIELEGAEVFVKLESQGLVGSIKDRPALWVLKQAIRRGEVNPETSVVESSSGNYALALAAYCRWLGLRFIPVIDPKTAPVNEAILRAMCPQVEMVRERDDTGGYLKTRLRRVRALRDEVAGAFWTNQYGNLDGALGHYHLTGGEICEQLSALDYVFVGVSSAGTITGLSMRLKERFPNVKIIAVDSVGSVIFGGPAHERFIPGIGASSVPELLARATIDDVVMVPEIDAVAACRELMTRHRIFGGGSTGSVFAGVKRYLASPRGTVKPKVLFLCADRGTAYLNTIYDDQWTERLKVRT